MSTTDSGGSDNFARCLLRVAVAQTAKVAGFHCSSDTALEVLTDVTIQYMETIGSVAKEYAELAGRTDVNFVDFVQAYSDIHPGDRMEVLEELHLFMQSFQNKTSQDVPDFPVKKRRIQTEADALNRLKLVTNGGSGEIEKEELSIRKEYNIPDWMPRLPPLHSYRKTDVLAVKRINDPKDKIEESIRQRAYVQNNLSRLSDEISSITKKSLGSESIISRPIRSTDDVPVDAAAGDINKSTVKYTKDGTVLNRFALPARKKSSQVVKPETSDVLKVVESSDKDIRIATGYYTQKREEGRKKF